MNSINKKFKSIQVCFSNYWKYFVFLKSRFPPLLPNLKGWASDGPPAELNIMAQSTSSQRVQRLIDSVPLTNLLFTLLSTSYKKVLLVVFVICICSLQLCCFIDLNINCDIVIQNIEQKKRATDFVWCIFIFVVFILFFPYKISGCLDDYLLKPAIFKCRYTAADFWDESWKLSVSQPNF